MSVEGQARQIAALKEAEGHRTRVVDVENAYDRFSGGVMEPAAVQALIPQAVRGGAGVVACRISVDGRVWFDAGADGFRIDVAHGLLKAAGLPDLGEAAKPRLGQPLPKILEAADIRGNASRKNLELTFTNAAV